MRIAKGTLFALCTASLLAGCTRSQDEDIGSLATVHAVLQKDAPVQIVSISPSGDNELAAVTIKNNTDRYVQSFFITWTVFRPVNCAASGTAPRIQEAITTATSVNLPRRIWRIWRGDAGILTPQEQTKIRSLSLTRTELQEIAQKYNAKKLRVQVGMAQVSFTTGDNFTSRNGPPGWNWRDGNVKRTNILDAEDAASAACP